MQRELPEWSDLIGYALVWREVKNEEPVDEVIYLTMVQFVNLS